ncbi:unnamed protein product, partial [marine sediment metagenome]
REKGVSKIVWPMIKLNIPPLLPYLDKNIKIARPDIAPGTINGDMKIIFKNSLPLK